MHMTGFAFVYVLLPAIMAVFLLAPVAWRPGVLLVLSLGYLFLAAPGFLLPIASGVAMDWAAILIMERYDERPIIRRCCVAFSVLKNIGYILWYGGSWQAGALHEPPFGLSVYALSAMGCILEIFRRETPYERNPAHFALYCCYFPRLAAGPLSPYADFAPQLRSLRPSLLQIGRGFVIFIGGAVKAGVLSVSLQAFYNALCALPEDDVTILSTWCVLFILALSVYYLLSGFADIAQGLGVMMGISLPKNFYYPYQSQSVSDFFQRFNNSVGSFFSRNAAIPCKGERGPLAGIFGLLATGVLTGLWFGLKVNYLAWGVFISLFIILEKYAYPGLMVRIPTLFRRGYTLFVLIVSFVIFGADTLPSGVFLTIRRMFGYGSLLFVNDRLGYLLASNWLLLVVSVVFASSAHSLSIAFIRRHIPWLSAVLSGASGVALLIVLTVFSM